MLYFVTENKYSLRGGLEKAINAIVYHSDASIKRGMCVHKESYSYYY